MCVSGLCVCVWGGGGVGLACNMKAREGAYLAIKTALRENKLPQGLSGSTLTKHVHSSSPHPTPRALWMRWWP